MKTQLQILMRKARNQLTKNNVFLVDSKLFQINIKKIINDEPTCQRIEEELQKLDQTLRENERNMKLFDDGSIKNMAEEMFRESASDKNQTTTLELLNEIETFKLS